MQKGFASYYLRSLGYKPTAAKTVEEYAKLDAEDESLTRWKASLGITDSAAKPSTGPKVLHSFSTTTLSDAPLDYCLTFRSDIPYFANWQVHLPRRPIRGRHVENPNFHQGRRRIPVRPTQTVSYNLLL